MGTTGLTATGVIVRIRETCTEYGMHDACADDLIGQLVTAGFDLLSDDMPAVIIGPLFASLEVWACAHAACPVGAASAA